MIDIRELSNKTFDITLQDGTVLNIRKPSNELFKETLKIFKTAENQEEDKKINVIYIFLTKILNRNTNNIKLTQTKIENDIDIDIAVYLIKKYQEFLNEVMQDINF